MFISTCDGQTTERVISCELTDQENVGKRKQ